MLKKDFIKGIEAVVDTAITSLSTSNQNDTETEDYITSITEVSEIVTMLRLEADTLDSKQNLESFVHGDCIAFNKGVVDIVEDN